jgi:hypothetical protein
MTPVIDAPAQKLRPPDLVNLHPQTDEQTGRGHLSHSSISTQLNCLRKFGWAYVERLEPIDRARPLSLGSAFATALEHANPDTGAAQLDRPTSDQAEHDRLEIDKAIIRAAAGLYLTRFGAKTGEARELAYRIRLRSPYTGAWSRTFDLVGRADGVIDHGDYLELIEDKLVGRVDAVQVKKVRLDRQVGLASYALWRVTGKPVRVIRYRWVKKPSERDGPRVHRTPRRGLRGPSGFLQRGGADVSLRRRPVGDRGGVVGHRGAAPRRDAARVLCPQHVALL